MTDDICWQTVIAVVKEKGERKWGGLEVTLLTSNLSLIGNRWLNRWSRVSTPRRRIHKYLISSSSFLLLPPGDATQLDLVGSLYVGSVDYMDPYLRLPPTLWSGTLRYGFVGCLKALSINAAAYDVVQYAHQQDVGKPTGNVHCYIPPPPVYDWLTHQYLIVVSFSAFPFTFAGSIRSSCHKMPGHCHDHPCMHGGMCTEGWNRFVCDCSQTSFSGATCGNSKHNYVKCKK